MISPKEIERVRQLSIKSLSRSCPDSKDIMYRDITMMFDELERNFYQDDVDDESRKEIVNHIKRQADMLIDITEEKL